MLAITKIVTRRYANKSEVEELWRAGVDVFCLTSALTAYIVTTSEYTESFSAESVLSSLPSGVNPILDFSSHYPFPLAQTLHDDLLGNQGNVLNLLNESQTALDKFKGELTLDQERDLKEESDKLKDRFEACFKQADSRLKLLREFIWLGTSLLH